ncbi:DNA primase, large subunit [Tilletiopsis washingtonensis]|uniref:DNA primase, large subunit n=1 Tax=Tilletiopsis washingtonensis TaxID=58919 RepID=A0A316ZFW2_9BASI|nr:DNA primase, large subunit [Tilletiopsis washingtonensis]PWN99924.1 DNA primase, large subunit [Tilletiopsis washingtonensis]
MFRVAPASASGATAGAGSSTAPTVASHATKGPRQYPFRLNFYQRPPTHEVTIEQFELWAIDRLRVLAEVESSQARNRSWPEMREAVLAMAKKYLPLNSTTAGSGGGVDLTQERMKDHVSHFVLRLAFCRSEDLRRRFLKAESTLFRLRFDTDDAAEREAFLQTLNFDWVQVSSEEKQANKDALLATTPWLKATFDNESFFKVHWTRVADLVEKRRVFLQAGTAWVPMREQSSLVVTEFQTRLSRDLELTARALPRLDEDDRLLPVLAHLSLGFIAGVSSDYSDSAIKLEDGGHISASHVDALVRKHAPLCMRNLHESLRRDKHLKHYGRLQYNLFLKDMGLPIEEALLFWRRSFANKTDEQFSKEYKYNIRHGYGLEGKRVNYPAKSCVRIITQDQPGPQDNHGCPFRHFSPANLSAALATHYGLAPAEQSEILTAVKAEHYHVGCTRLFELTHAKKGIRKGDGLGNGESVNHPNRYFERSWEVSRESGDVQMEADPDDSMAQEEERRKKLQQGVASQEPKDEFDDETMDELMRAAADQGQTQWAGAAVGTGSAARPIPGPFDDEDRKPVIGSAEAGDVVMQEAP